MTAETQIRAIMEDRVKAVRARDLCAVTSHYATDILSFDVVNPLRCSGAAAISHRLTEWFSSFQGPIDYEIGNLSVAAAADVAFCHSLNRVNATRTDGQKIDMWWRATVCFRKVDDNWRITHEHSSVPFDAQSGRASLDLRP